MKNHFFIKAVFLFSILQVFAAPILFGQEFQKIILRETNLERLEFLMDSLDSIHQLQAKSGDYVKAAESIKGFNNASFRWQNLTDSLQVAEMKAKHQLDIQTAKIALEETRLANQKRIITISLIIGVISIFVLLLIRRNIRLNTKKEAEKFQLIQLQEKVKAELKEEQIRRTNQEKEALNQEIELKNQELSFQILQSIDKNQLLLNIQDKISNRENTPEFLFEIKTTIREQINPDSDWKAFLKQFETVYPNFFPRLKQVNQKLTENDFKLSVLVRLQMSSKEIASLLGLSPDSVKTARYRLGKKLGLEKGKKLHAYLTEIE